MLIGGGVRRRRARPAPQAPAGPPPLPELPPPALLLVLAAVTVTWALPERVLSAIETALTVTIEGDGTVAGAV